MNIDLIDKYAWYRQGSDVAMFYAHTPLSTFISYFGSEYSIAVFENVKGNFYWPIQVAERKAEKIFEIQKKNPNHIKDYLAKWGRIRKEMWTWIESLSLENISKEEIIEIIIKYYSFDKELWWHGFYPELFDGVDESLIKKNLSGLNIDIDEYDFKQLCLPTKIPFLSQVKLDISRKMDSKELSKKYYFIHNDWANVEFLSSEFFKKEKINDEKLCLLDDYSSNRKMENEELVLKNKLPIQMINLFIFAQELALFRDMRKVNMQKCNYFLFNLCKKASSFLKIDYKNLLYLYPFELSNLLKGQKEIFDLIEKRKGDFTIEVKDDKLFHRYGEEASIIIKKLKTRLHSQFEKIKGRIGNKGNVKGKVKIILGRNDFDKFKEGDIIVAPMTRSEYMPLMKKASAIITDEGGITSHAAIISRELNKPCVIGTQIATELLKDNDLVEVDANQGVVRKIAGGHK